MKLIIAGSRTFTDYQLLCQTLAPDRHRITEVLTGGARGAEQLGYRWAWKHAIRHQLFRADWERFGKSAGVRRNYQMAQAGDLLIVFWDGQSPGTTHMVQWASITASATFGHSASPDNVTGEPIMALQWAVKVCVKHFNNFSSLQPIVIQELTKAFLFQWLTRKAGKSNSYTYKIFCYDLK